MSNSIYLGGKNFRLRDVDPNSTGTFATREDAEKKMARDLNKLFKLHYKMFAENKRALLIVLHGIDASGKDGTVRHLACGLSPMGFQAHGFVQPSPEELDHDYLWRAHKVTPARGDVAIFNRSYYEEVSVVRVHADILATEHLPKEIVTNSEIFKQRYRQINDFERMLSENGTIVLKFLLHISKEEQKSRLAARLDRPERNWKYNPGDETEREYWDEYMKVFEEVIRHTSTDEAPWHVIPANKKWFRNYAITRTIVKRLKKLEMEFPRVERAE